MIGQLMDDARIRRACAAKKAKYDKAIELATAEHGHVSCNICNHKTCNHTDGHCYMFSVKPVTDPICAQFAYE